MTHAGQKRSQFFNNKINSTFPTKLCLWLLPLQIVLLACKSLPNQGSGGQSRTISEQEELKSLLNSARVVECKLVSHEWFIPGDVQQAKVVRNKNNMALIYQALLRSGPRTVYQSLTPGFAFQGDGFVVGLKSYPNVSDFDVFEDATGNMITTSRTKPAGSELYKAMVEINVSDKTWRSILPTEPNETVQQIWPSLPAANGLVNVVVRTTPTEDSSASGQDDESNFHWFQVGSGDNSARRIGKFSANNVNIEPSAFFSFDKSGEPVAIAVVKSKSNSDAIDGPSSSTPARISLVRLFTRSIQEHVLFNAQGNITALNATLSRSSPKLHLSWLFTARRGGSRYIQSTTLSTQSITERAFGKPNPRESELPMATEIAYEGNEPHVQFTNASNQFIPILGWWGKLEEDVSVLLHPLTGGPKSAKPQLLKASDGTTLGASFIPTLAVVPPKKFSRILSFTTAATTAEKNIMVLSDRSDSADLQKETILHACTF